MVFLCALNRSTVWPFTNVKVLGLVNGPSPCSAHRYSIRLLVACGSCRGCCYPVPTPLTFCMDRSPSAGIVSPWKFEKEALLVEVPPVLEVLLADPSAFCGCFIIEPLMFCKDRSPSADIGSSRNGKFGALAEASHGLEVLDIATGSIVAPLGHEMPGSSCCVRIPIFLAVSSVPCLSGASSLFDLYVAMPFPLDGCRFKLNKDWRRVSFEVVFLEEVEELNSTSLTETEVLDCSSPTSSVLVPS